VRLVLKVAVEVTWVVAVTVPPFGSLIVHVNWYGIPVIEVVTFRTKVMV
jgi:hypothetical protein